MKQPQNPKYKIKDLVRLKDRSWDTIVEILWEPTLSIRGWVYIIYPNPYYPEECILVIEDDLELVYSV